MRTANQWFDAYSSDHRNATNQTIHWICVPVILWCVMMWLWLVPSPTGIDGFWALLSAAAALGFYTQLSARLGFAMLLWLALNALVARAALVALGGQAAFMLAMSLFILAWLGQFVGHAIEGRRPSFFTDLSYLLIGPAWLMGKALRRAGWPVA
ncbi:Mpo1 family 2-hydroxy fatty acid dioxygenase [Silvimonas amylolytica]|uniref:Membrane protein n=1 Tax=Silvimonas amylolytica TaxID=449663 RepID=A0ABQ2PMM8_9NEIS|nr:Mpo1-like protein [Silvimonas amylolytica]GGP26566.1 membrane protein [Silvimonas amylolytica]